jgi:hypothetical protein
MKKSHLETSLDFHNNCNTKHVSALLVTLQRTLPFRTRHIDRLDPQAVSLGIFDNRRQMIEANFVSV